MEKDTLAAQIKQLSQALRRTRDERLSMIDEQQRLAAALARQVLRTRGACPTDVTHLTLITRCSHGNLTSSRNARTCWPP